MTASATAAAPTIRRVLPFVLALAAASAARAQEGLGEPLWEVGAFAFGVSQQAYPGADQNVQRALALPFVLYRGRVLRADRETAGLRAFKTETFELDIGVAGAFGSSSKDIDARRGMDDLGTLVEFGPRLKWNLGEVAGGRVRLELPLRGVFDLNDSLAHRGMAFEPELQWRTRTEGGWFWSLGAGAIFADRRLADTFYRVTAAEVTPDRPAYDARAGRVAWRGSVSVARSLGPDWRVFGFVRTDSVAGAANEDSPLVRRTTGATAGIGLSWTWMRSERRAADE
jgi:outer membrane protein